MTDSKGKDRIGELRQQADKDANYLVLVGAILVFVHLLDIQPSEIEALGAKITLKDPIALRGAIAAVFLHILHIYLLNVNLLNSIDKSFDINKQLGRGLIKHYTRRGRSTRSVKIRARLHMYARMILFFPYTLAAIMLMSGAFAVAIYDIWALLAYCYENMPIGHWLQNAI